MGRNVLDDLKARVASLPAEWRARVRFAIFALSGFTDELRAAARREQVALVTGADLLRP